MIRCRLTHTIRPKFNVAGDAINYSGITQHVWRGQLLEDSTEQWVDLTTEYPDAQSAELALLRSLIDVEFEPTFEH
jgi:hypothetical protein